MRKVFSKIKAIPRKVVSLYNKAPLTLQIFITIMLILAWFSLTIDMLNAKDSFTNFTGLITLVLGVSYAGSRFYKLSKMEL